MSFSNCYRGTLFIAVTAPLPSETRRLAVRGRQMFGIYCKITSGVSQRYSPSCVCVCLCVCCLPPCNHQTLRSRDRWVWCRVGAPCRMRPEPMIPTQGKRTRRDANVVVSRKPPANCTTLRLGASLGSLVRSLGENQTIGAMVMN